MNSKHLSTIVCLWCVQRFGVLAIPAGLILLALLPAMLVIYLVVTAPVPKLLVHVVKLLCGKTTGRRKLTKVGRCCCWWWWWFWWWWLVGWLVAECPSNMPVYLMDGSVQTSVRTSTLRQKLRVNQCHLTRSPYTDTGPASFSAGLITPGAWQGSH